MTGRHSTRWPPEPQSENPVRHSGLDSRSRTLPRRGPSSERRGVRPPEELTSAGRHHDRIDRNDRFDRIDRWSLRPKGAKWQGSERIGLRPSRPRHGAARRARGGAKRGQQLAVGGAEVHRGQLLGRNPGDLLMLLGNRDGAGADGARDEDEADRLFGVAVEDRTEDAARPRNAARGAAPRHDVTGTAWRRAAGRGIRPIPSGRPGAGRSACRRTCGTFCGTCRASALCSSSRS